jgi:DENN domain-containing protein 4
LPFPKEIAMFGLPMGAVIESWPNSINVDNLKKPVFSTFVLNITSDDGSVLNEKVYGSSLAFYEEIENPSITNKINSILGFNQEKDLSSSNSRKLYANKSLILLSRNPFFKSFKKFLLFIFNYYAKKENLLHEKGFVPLERYLCYLIYEIPYPSQQKPRVLINLTEKDEDCLSINMPNECQLPQSSV